MSIDIIDTLPTPVKRPLRSALCGPDLQMDLRGTVGRGETSANQIRRLALMTLTLHEIADRCNRKIVTSGMLLLFAQYE